MKNIRNITDNHTRDAAVLKKRVRKTAILSFLLLAVYMTLPALAGETTDAGGTTGTSQAASSASANVDGTVRTGSGKEKATVNFSLSQSFVKPDGIETVPQTGSACTYSLKVSEGDTPGGYLVSEDEDYSVTCEQDGQTADALKEDFRLSGDQASLAFQAAFQHAGVYSFTLKQTTETVDAFKYDRTVYILRFYVKNEQSGGLTATLTAETSTSDDESASDDAPASGSASASGESPSETSGADNSSAKKEEISYENTYSPAITDPPIEKKVTDEKGEKKDTEDTFTFELRPDRTGWPLPEGAEGGVKTLSLKGNSSGEFGNIVFLQAGTYTYSAAEANKTETSRYQYDDHTYKYTYNVQRVNPDDPDDGSLKVVREEGTDPVIFTNIVKDPETEKPHTGNGHRESTGGTDSTGRTGGSVKTGDSTPVALYLAVLLAMALVMTTSAAVLRRRRR